MNGRTELRHARASRAGTQPLQADQLGLRCGACQAQATLYRTLLAGKKMLVVLDNARDSAQIRPLLPGTPHCLVLVTSRNQLAGLVAADGARPLLLDLLTPAEARDLLTRRLGFDRVTAEPDAIEQIITACARLPLALAIVAARAATQPQLSMADLAKELHDRRNRLDTLTTSETSTDARAVFSWSYQPSAPTPPDCSVTSAAYTLARTSRPRPRPASPACAHPGCGRCWPS